MRLKGSADDPLWYKDAVIYETHVKAFFDSNNDGMGDFRGLLKKLDYLQELGITCIWLLPFFPSPLRDDGYDIAYYDGVHPNYGTLDDFKAFLKAAHERKLQVVIELVINHTSDQHPWFQRARKSPKGSPERDFYVWSDTDQKYKDTRIIFIDTEKSNWSWDSEAQAYYWHRFFSHQPDLNFENPTVLKEVIEVMRFWLDMGVDGLRLDAIPYLREREGTSCENLPETHEVLKEIRRQLDARYENRVFLAEANQWPEDVRAYFGDGDECHMAFHFPVMPRIFMAVRMEDRTPIVEIMKRTPPIPDTCQWGMFLRNHDELTLEMVTDEERDYMYKTYAADARMRINVGIRRRLAPLMENSRLRIELLHSLLFTFPGTPIIYYGDELGMGDNVYLGDRNGVRTPMQWSADRNAGFSRCNPAQLYSPPIMDSVYGYEAVNVESQQEDPSSLLNWMKNIISLRKHKVFGRGSMEFLEPSNPKVLVYAREYQDDKILCVANLSRFPQPVELDLSKFKGLEPVETMGNTRFPALGELPYFLTLGPYGFYSFELQPARPAVEVAVRGEEVFVSAVTLAIAAPWAALFEDGPRNVLETEVLPSFLQGRRWFAGKAQVIESVEIVDWTELSAGLPPFFFTLVEVRYQEGPPQTYTLALGIGTGKGAKTLAADHPEWVLCSVKGPEKTGVLYDALVDETACRELVAGIREGRKWACRHGTLEGFSTAAFLPKDTPVEADLTVRHSSAEQSNSSVFYGDQFILKLIRRLQPGLNPDYEIGRYLTEEQPFTRVPPVYGAFEYRRSEEEPATVAVLQAFVENQGDGWQTTLDELGRYFEDRSLDHHHGQPPDVQARALTQLSEQAPPGEFFEIVGVFLERVATLGTRTAELHLALGHPAEEPNFSPQAFTESDYKTLAANMRASGEEVLELLERTLPSLPENQAARARLAVDQGDEIRNRFGGLVGHQPATQKIRIHGDYHLGQVLLVENDFYIIDFEGEPARPMHERRSKQCPMKDVAGMIRSFSYAAHASLITFVSRRSTDFQKLQPWAEFWETGVSAAFLHAYRETAKQASFLPKQSQKLQVLLDAFLLDKCLYELKYELNNRPDWAHIPLHGLLKLLGAGA